MGKAQRAHPTIEALRRTNTFVEVNTQGGLEADMRVQLDGIVNLDAADFIL